VLFGSGEECPAAFTPAFILRPFELVLAASGGGVGVTLSLCSDGCNSALGRLFAAAVSRGGGCGRSLA